MGIINHVCENGVIHSTSTCRCLNSHTETRRVSCDNESHIKKRAKSEFLVTITERTPTEDGTDVNTYHVTCESMMDAVRLVTNAEYDFTVFVNVNIARIKSI